MSSKKETTFVLIERQLVIFLRPRSTVWQCRYQINGQWQRNSTNQRDREGATKRAYELLVEANVRKKLDYAPITRYFKDIAHLAAKRMDEDTAIGKGKVSYKEYKVTIEKYLIPFFGKYKVDSLDYALLQKFDEWRTKKMGSAPSHSTLLNHNAALNKVLDVAVKEGYMVAGNRPTLAAKGAGSVRRQDFNLDEARALIDNFDKWISRGKADSIQIRMLLKDYVSVLLDTGARPGNELMNLEWVHIRKEAYHEEIHTGEMADDGEGDIHEIVQVNANYTAYISIPESKTKSRVSVGRSPTVKALRSIADRNYGKTLEEMLSIGSHDKIFMYREYLNSESIKSNKIAQLRKPTSFPKLFDLYLREHNLQIDPIKGQKRVLYSLRHTYATLALTYDKNAEIRTLAKQMGTSVQMIEKHYDHLDVVKAAHKLRGEESRRLLQAPGIIDLRYIYNGDNAT